MELRSSESMGVKLGIRDLRVRVRVYINRRIGGKREERSSI